MVSEDGLHQRLPKWVQDTHELGVASQGIIFKNTKSVHVFCLYFDIKPIDLTKFQTNNNKKQITHLLPTQNSYLDIQYVPNDNTEGLKIKMID